MVVNGIDTKDISVVVQGAIDREITPLCLESIRKHLPGSEIILSTWKGSKVDGLDYDQLLLNDDPGGFDLFNEEYPVSDNTNRQIYSTMQGLRSATKEYAVKMRTDFLLESAGFLNWFGKYPSKNREYSFFKSKVICCDCFSRDARYLRGIEGLRYVLHPADFFFFGYAEDLLDLFDIPLVTQETKVWFAIQKDEMTVKLSAFPAEEYLWVGFLRKHLKDTHILPVDSSLKTPALYKLTEVTFAANLIILSHQQIGLQCGKGPLKAKLKIYNKNCYTHKTWLSLYQYYCQHFPLLYLLYRLLTFVANSVYLFKKSVVTQLKRFKKSAFWKKMRSFLVKNLTEKERGILNPLYVKARSVFKKCMRVLKEEKNYGNCFFDENVTDTNLSIVIYGEVTASASECVNCIQRLLPKAELIISTWAGNNTVGLKCDKLVLIKDPGHNGVICNYPERLECNINRTIVSCSAALKYVTRRYSLCMCSDILLRSTDFLRYYNQYSIYIGQETIVSRRIMVEGLSVKTDLPFNIGAEWHLGLTNDLRRLYDVPLFLNKQETYFEQKAHVNDCAPFSGVLPQYLPGQYIFYSFFKKCGGYLAKPINVAHTFDNRQECIEAYRKFIADNLLCIEMDKSGVLLPKSVNVSNPAQYCGTMPGSAWLELCHTYGTLPNSMKDRELTESFIEMQKEFQSNPIYYNIENYANTIKNYAAFKGNVSFPTGGGKIDPADITFVVSGDIVLDGDLNTHHCLVSIRRFFPKSRIILSTWDGAPMERLKGLYDQLVLLPKPVRSAGSRVRSDDLKAEHPFNREQSCVHAGMKEVRTKYAVRMRPDFYLFNDHFLPFYVKWSAALSQREASYAIFQQRVLSLKLSTFDPRCGYAYSLSNYFQFGLTEDLLLLWDGHQEMLGSLTYFERQPAYKPENPAGVGHRYMAEQYFLLNVVQKAKPKLPYPQYYCDRSDDRFAFETEKVYASNIIIGSSSQLGIASGFDDRNITGIYSLERLLEIYLYNVEPSNQPCLNYLREAYRPQEVQKRRKASIILLPFWLLLLCAKNILRAVYRGGKTALRVLLPGYRTACGVRERQIAQEQVEQARYDHLVDRINQLEQALAQKDAQLKTAEHKRRPKRDR